MKDTLKKVLPKPILNILKQAKLQYNILKAFREDRKRFSKAASLNNKRLEIDNLRAIITYHYHALEKGLSNPDIRLGFGKSALDNLYEALTEYDRLGYSKNDIRYRTGISVVQEYINLHESENYDVSSVKKRFNKYLSEDNELIGGISFFSNDKLSLENSRTIGFADLANRRVSVRTYSNEPVDISLIEEAIAISMKTPSVCNRQPWRTYIIKNKDFQKHVFENQKGFKGYDQSVDTLIMVSVDVKYMLGVNERNQGFIDGGMFSMSLLYALEYVGLAACALNAALPIENDKKIREILNVSDSENLVMFIAVGHFPKYYKVPKSQRDNYKEINRYFY